MVIKADRIDGQRLRDYLVDEVRRRGRAYTEKRAAAYYTAARRIAPVRTGRFRRSLRLVSRLVGNTRRYAVVATVPYAPYVIRYHNFWRRVAQAARRSSG